MCGIPKQVQGSQSAHTSTQHADTSNAVTFNYTAVTFDGNAVTCDDNAVTFNAVDYHSSSSGRVLVTSHISNRLRQKPQVCASSTRTASRHMANDHRMTSHSAQGYLAR